MSIKKLNNFAIGNEDFSALFETVNKAYKGKNDSTLSNYDNDSSPDVKVGSVFDNNGAIFVVDGSDITPADYGTISVSTVFYLYHNGSTNVFEYSETVPSWDDEKQGWYDGNSRALFSMFKDSGGTLYENKNKLLDQNNYIFPNNISVSGLINDRHIVNGGIRVETNNNYEHSSTIVQNTLYDKLASIIPQIGNIMALNGMFNNAGTNVIASHAERTTATTIVLRGMTLAGSTTVGQSVVDGSASTFPGSLSW